MKHPDISWHYELEATELAVSACLDAFEVHIDGNEVAQRARRSLGVVLDEVLTNVVKHAFADGGEGQVEISLDSSAPGFFTLRFQDNGVAFNPLYQPAPPKLASIPEIRPGGLGIFMIRRLAASLRYLREDDQNVLIVRIPTTG